MSHVTVEHAVFIEDMKKAFEVAREETRWDPQVDDFETIYDVRAVPGISTPVNYKDFKAVQGVVDGLVKAHLDTWNNGMRFRGGNRYALDVCAAAIPVQDGRGGRRGWLFVANIHE